MKVNKQAVEHAKKLIRAGSVVMDSDWGDSQPSASSENKYLDDHNWRDYGEWYLALDPDENEETKDHHKFPYGDFKRVHRSGVIAAKQRAAQNDYNAVEKAADELLDMIDAEKQ